MGVALNLTRCQGQGVVVSANKFAERLTRENAAVLLVDHQVGLYSGVRDIPVGELKHNVMWWPWPRPPRYWGWRWW
jgi:hypothetical protein